MEPFNNSVRQDAKQSWQDRTQRNTFAEKYPGQAEHILRLITEKLHTGLDKRDGDNDPNHQATWKLTSGEIADLAEAMWHLHQVYITMPKKV
jgi:hypothetical protein